MKCLLDMPEYQEDVKRVASLDLPWQTLDGKTVLVTGARGMIGSFLIDALMQHGDIKVIAVGRNEAKLRERFGRYENVGYDASAKADYVIHLASNTHPVAYATDPIGTIECNVIMTKQWLDYAADNGCTRFLFASSNEIYGENRGDVELFDEKYCGYIDCNTLRAGYPESKRCGEALCQAYIKQKNLNVVVARLTRTFGPTILPTDTKAISQFFNNALRGEDIVLKSEGRQYYSYQYVADSVSGLLTVLLKGECGEAYNVADESGDITLRDLASLIAAEAGRKVVFDLPNAVEAAGFSKATKARLDGSKLRTLGWRPMYDVQTAVARNYRFMKLS